MPPTHAQRRRLLKYFVESIRQHPGWPRILTEGDSWFSFPLHRNLVDFLDEGAQRRLSMLRLERGGDELLSILSGKQRVKLRRYLERYDIQALLLSGGGNDIAGRDLFYLLRQRSHGMTWRQVIHDDRVERRLLQLELALQEVLDIRDEARPSCVIYVHSYDYAIPSGEPIRVLGMKVGPWLKDNLVDRGVDDPQDRQKIVSFLIDGFNERLAQLARERRAFVHVDARGTLSAGDWHDELHPTRSGFHAVAQVFRTELARQFPATF